MYRKKRVLIVHDHPLFREGLKAVIGRSDEFEIGGEAGNGCEALCLALKIRPDVALVDDSLPDYSGIRLTKEMTRLLPQLSVIVISVLSGSNHYAAAFRSGAKGYLGKRSCLEVFLRGLQAVAGGGFCLDEPVSQEIVERFKRLPARTERSDGPDCRSLTTRQREVLALIARGHSYKTIGEMLCVSPRTVEKHRSAIADKLELSARADLTIFAVKSGIIRLDAGEPEGPFSVS